MSYVQPQWMTYGSSGSSHAASSVNRCVQAGVSSRFVIRRKAREPTIFVALAAYCEPELDLTIRDIIGKARRPRRLRFGICLQHDESGQPEVREDCIDHFLDDERFQIIKVDHRTSEGGCWARFFTQGLYRGEDYTLRLDAHSRVVENWDERYISMLDELPSEKPLITGFPRSTIAPMGATTSAAIPISTSCLRRSSSGGCPRVGSTIQSLLSTQTARYRVEPGSCGEPSSSHWAAGTSRCARTPITSTPVRSSR